MSTSWRFQIARFPRPRLRVAIAFALAAGSFAALRQASYDSCDVGGFVGWLLLAPLFTVSFIWLLGEGLRAIWPAASGVRGWLVPLTLGVMAYAAIGAAVWKIDPTNEGYHEDTPLRAWESGFWSIGVLQETNNFPHLNGTCTE